MALPDRPMTERASAPRELAAHDLGCSRGEHELFCGLNFSLRSGEALLIQGGNGHGKTSLLRLLTGLSQPASGEVHWRGMPLDEVREDYHREMAYIGHLNGIKDDLTPVENVQLAARLNGRTQDAGDTERILTELGLGSRLDLPCRVLSFGQRRRVALAALLGTPALLWILDEPFTGLDAHGIALLEGRIRTHLEHGGMAVLTTHQPLSLDGAAVRTLRMNGSLDSEMAA
jgi:heme exporter protein A